MWSSLPQIAKMLMGGVADDTPETRRAAVVALTAKMVAP